jgi:hypothetical protein
MDISCKGLRLDLTNLTNRVSMYNKTDEHEVVYYQEFIDEDSMGIIETLVFKKLQSYREQANRERFILPEDKDIKYFVDIIKECINFILSISKIFSCKVCQTEFSTKEHLKRHMIKYTDFEMDMFESNKKLKQKICDTEFSHKIDISDRKIQVENWKNQLL